MSIHVTGPARDGRGVGSVVLMVCTDCKANVEIPMDFGEWQRYCADKLALPRERRRSIQEYFPAMSAAHREMFISGTCPTCWDLMFPPEGVEEGPSSPEEED